MSLWSISKMNDREGEGESDCATNSPRQNMTVPLETYSYIFTFLDVITCTRMKLVCKEWYHIVTCMYTHCGYFQFHYYPAKSSMTVLTTIIKVKAQIMSNNINDTSCSSVETNIYSNGNQNQNEQHHGQNEQQQQQLKRTRGHLLNPIVFDNNENTSNWIEFHSSLFLLDTNHNQTKHANRTNANLDEDTCTYQALWKMQLIQNSSSPHFMTAMIRCQQNTLYKERCLQMSSYITSLDLESMRISSSYNIPTTAAATTTTLSSKSLKKSLQIVDFSPLTFLKALSIRGCSNLKIVRLPPYIQILDASACSCLQEITFPTIKFFLNETNVHFCNDKNKNSHHHGNDHNFCVRAMNLNGCRSLINIHFFNNIIKHIIELDMTSVSSMSNTLIVNALQHSQVLQTLSLRYIATNNMVESLASSIANNSLRMIDLSFSHQVTDTSIEVLVRKSKMLERCNLRGNIRISGECYNRVPIYLYRRKKGELSKEEQVFNVKVTSNVDSCNEKKKKQRKGDNLFFFCN